MFFQQHRSRNICKLNFKTLSLTNAVEKLVQAAKIRMSFPASLVHSKV